MPRDPTPDAVIGTILRQTRTIALVGASANPARPSFLVLRDLAAHGYRVFPVNPGLAGGTIQGLAVLARLADVPEPIDMVDIFRNAEAAAGIVEEALALEPLPRVVWMQLGVRNDAAAERAEAAGLTVVMDRCPKIELARLSGETGIGSGLPSTGSRRGAAATRP